MALSFQSTSNQRQQQQHQHTQSYQSAASIFATIEENLVKKVLHIIGVQQNDKNIMTATICNVIDTVTANTYNMLNKTVNGLADTINNNNNIMLNKINDIIGKNNKNIMNHINNSMNKMDKKIDGIKTKIMSEEEEKESLVEILLNDIDIIKSKINLYESNNNKCDEINVIKSSINEQSGIMDQMEIKRNKNNMNLMNNINELNKKMSDIIIKMDENNKIHGVIKKLDKENKANKCAEEEKGKLVEILLNEIDDIKSSIQKSGELELKRIKNTEKWEKTVDDKLNKINNKLNIFETNVIKKENIMMENINNKLKKLENNLKNKLNTSPDRMVNKLEEINVNILKLQNDFEASAMSNAVALQRVNKNLVNSNYKKIPSIPISTDKVNDNNNKTIEISPSSSSSTPLSSTSTSTPKQTSNNDNKLLIINSINKIDNNRLTEIYIDSDFQVIMGITTKCVIGIIKKIIIGNNKNKNKNKNKNEYKIIIGHFGKIYKFFIKPKREMTIKDMIGYISNYNFMSFPYQHLYVNGEIISESLSINELITNNKIY